MDDDDDDDGWMIINNKEGHFREQRLRTQYTRDIYSSRTWWVATNEWDGEWCGWVVCHPRVGTVGPV